MNKQITDEELKVIIQQSICWSDALRKCGKKPAGGTLQFFQKRVRKLNFDVSHFLGKATCAGERQTGICKKKHWSEVLVLRKTEDRDRSKRIRKSYSDYCKEHNIPIKCVDCNNGGIWKDKKLILQINHIDECRWNNIPNNLEWLCPNCHSVKTNH